MLQAHRLTRQAEEDPSLTRVQVEARRKEQKPKALCRLGRRVEGSVLLFCSLGEVKGTASATRLPASQQLTSW